MSEQEIRLPKLGESITGASVVQWLKNVGDFVSLDEPLLEVTTDKVNSEIPSPYSGVLIEQCAQIDQEIEEGALLARLSTQAVSSNPSPILEPSAEKSSYSQGTGAPTNAILSPAVIRLAQEEGLSQDDLALIVGTGEGGRVTKRDVQNYVDAKKQELSSLTLKNDVCNASDGSNCLSASVQTTVEMSSMRKAIAQNMVRSFYEAPHASLVLEVDVTDLMGLIKKEKARFLETHGAKLTITSFVIQALSKTLQKFPLLNASVKEDTIVLKHEINVGIAVHIEGGLLVPVVKNCEGRSLVSLAQEVQELAEKARSGKITAKQLEEGTITLTNFGMTGALIGVPIIRYPEVAIIGMGNIQKRVVVRDDDSLAIRQMLYLTLTFDHRVIDGIYGCEFLGALKHKLESLSNL